MPLLLVSGRFDDRLCIFQYQASVENIRQMRDPNVYSQGISLVPGSLLKCLPC